MAEVRLENITKLFEGHIIGLKDFNLEVKDGEFAAILGPSGSGKSTALRIIAGLEHQDKGSIFIDGINVNKHPPQGRDVAFVFQSYALYPHMDVYENIAVGLRIKGCSKTEIQKRVQDVTDLLEIGKLLKRKPKALSGGQRQRVALARAIAKRPKVFLLDEPLSNLDALLRERMRAELKMLFNKLKATVIYVTHDQTEAMSLSDKIALINNGILKQAGSPDELYYQPKDLFVASFLGSPRINTLEADIIGENALICGKICLNLSSGLKSKLKNRKKVILGLRPEDIKVYLESKENTYLAQLILIERIGKYSILSLNWQGQILKAIIERDFIGQDKRDSIWFQFDMDKLYLFDKES